MQVKKLARTAVLSIATLASASSFAFINDGFDGVYVLGGVGYAGVENAQFGDRAPSSTAYGSQFESDAEFAWRGGLGAWVTDNFAVEFNYTGIHDMNQQRNFADSSQQKLNVTEMMFFDLSGVGRCYFDENFWGFARLGAAIAKVKREYSTDNVITSKEDEPGFGAALGIGAQYDFTDMFGVRLEASTVQALNDNDMYAVTASVVVNFDELM